MKLQTCGQRICWLGSEADLVNIPFSRKRILTAFWLVVYQTFNQSHIAWFKPAKSKSFLLTNKAQAEKTTVDFLIEKQIFKKQQF